MRLGRETKWCNKHLRTWNMILSRTVDKFLTRKRMLKQSQQWSHRTVDVSPSEEAHRLMNKFYGCSNSSWSIATPEPSTPLLSSSLCHSVHREAPTSVPADLLWWYRSAYDWDDDLSRSLPWYGKRCVHSEYGCPPAAWSWVPDTYGFFRRYRCIHHPWFFSVSLESHRAPYLERLFYPMKF